MTAIPGIDVGRAMTDRASSSVTTQLDESSAEAERLQVERTPTFFFHRRGEAPHRLELRMLLPSEFSHEVATTLS